MTVGVLILTLAVFSALGSDGKGNLLLMVHGKSNPFGHG